MGHKGGRRRPDPRRMTVGKAPKDHTHLGLCLQYSGSGFRGLQFQAHAPTCHTVEGVLIHALKDADIIAEVVRGRPGGEHHHFARSCRTDRGVHAVRNMVTLFIPNSVFAEVGQCEGICARLNARLPPMIRVAHVMVLSGSFIPRHCCNRRVYRYVLPLYALLPPCDTWAALDKYYPGCLAELQSMAIDAAAAHHTHYDVAYVDLAKLAAPAASSPPSPSWLRDLQASTARCNEVLRTHFTGSRRYHNFSVDIDSNRSGVSAKVIQPDKDEALRVIYRSEVCPRLFFFPCRGADGAVQHGASLAEYEANLTAHPPTPPPADGEGAAPAPASAPGRATTAAAGGAAGAAALPAQTAVLPFLLFQIEGGSFLLNMIRKVVGSLLAVCRGARESILDDAFSPERRVTTPLAPGPYLYLALSTYNGYDRSITGSAGQTGRFTTVQSAWSGPVSEAAEAFAFHQIAADIVDVDLNTMPPLDDILAARDRALAVRRPHTSVEDAHLAEMKEYKPVLPSRIAWPASGEMTVFLRLLRVHNWNVRAIRLDAGCKALREVRNRGAEAETAAAPAAVEASAAPATTPAQPEDGEVADARDGVPDGGEDGWVYAADSAEEAAAMRQAYFASWWKRARTWEYDGDGGNGAGDGGGGGEDDSDGDGDGDDAPPRRRQRT